ncbi:MAG TPA: NF038122 family metalloprotease [Verrucomicrobiae bacterium]|jgi:hypothetical protein|nr:NF038122 family metalloprotease [Verrucomicrobiae bacterium]
MKKIVCLASLWLFLFLRPAAALTIQVTYDPSITNAANPAEVKAAFGTAVQLFEDLYTNKTTLNITMYWGPSGPFTGGIGLGRSEFELVFSTYSEITNALRAHRASAEDTNSVASLPAVDPIGNGTNWLVPLAEARVLNMSDLPPDEDGEVGFATNVTYTFDPNNRSVPGKIDFIGVAEHEISEVLGRCSFSLQSYYVPYDLFRFTNNGARSFDPGATNAYFSVNNGATALKFFYTNAAFGDIQDWLSSATPDAYDAFSSSGHLLPVSTVDITTLDVLGYNGPGVLRPRLFLTNPTDGTIQIRFVNTPGSGFTVLESTNLSTPAANWTALGNPTENPAGQFQFTDTTATNQQRFYEVRSP